MCWRRRGFERGQEILKMAAIRATPARPRVEALPFVVGCPCTWVGMAAVGGFFTSQFSRALKVAKAAGQARVTVAARRAVPDRPQHAEPVLAGLAELTLDGLRLESM